MPTQRRLILNDDISFRVQKTVMEKTAWLGAAARGARDTRPRLDPPYEVRL